MINLIGLGVKAGDLSYNALQKLKSCNMVFVRTAQVESVKTLEQENINYISFDNLYLTSKNFDTLNKKIYSELTRASKEQDICFCVDGDVLEDRVCQKLISKKKCNVFNGVSKAGYYLSFLFPSVATYQPHYPAFHSKGCRPPIIHVDKNVCYKHKQTTTNKRIV